MQQQNNSKKVLVSFPPIHQLIKRYNSVSTSNLYRPNDPVLIQRKSSFISQKSSISQKSFKTERSRLLKQPSFFTKQSTIDSPQFAHQSSQEHTISSKQIKRSIDKESVIQTYKRLIQPKINFRLLDRNIDIVKVTNYQDFHPFKRNYQLSRKIPNINLANPQLQVDRNRKFSRK